MEESRLKFAEDEQPPAGQEAPARRMEAAAPKPGAGRPTKRRRMEIARAAGARRRNLGWSQRTLNEEFGIA